MTAALGTNQTLRGTKAKDTLTGGTGDDYIEGNGGADSLSGGAGSDRIISNLIWDGSKWQPDDAGDTLDGGDGYDTLEGGAGNDSILGGAGGDSLTGNGGKDTLLGGDGDDTLNSGVRWDGVAQAWRHDAVGDLLDGGNGSDTLTGSAGNDSLSGSSGNDSLIGGGGADFLAGGDGNDTLSSGNYFDYVTSTRPVDTAGDNFSGGAGNDYLTGANGNDTLDGGDDNDVISGGGGFDIIIGGAGNDMIESGNPIDPATNSKYADIIGDSISAGAGNDTVNGGQGNDTIDGGAGNDSLDGRGGADLLRGGDGDDVISNRQYTDIATNSAVENSIGSTLEGGAGNDRIFAGRGDDVLDGGEGNDYLEGGKGNDTIDGGSGANDLFGGSGDDTYFVRSLGDVVYESSGNDKATVYVDWYKPNWEVEEWSYAPGVQRLPYWIDSLAGGANRQRTDTTTQVVHYAFPQAAGANFSAADKNGFQAFTADQIVFTRRVLDYISTVIDVRFEEVSDLATPLTIAFGNNIQAGTSGYSSRINTIRSSPLMLNISSIRMNPSQDNGNSLYGVLLHEIGHELGLKHPFAGSDAGGVLGTGPYLSSAEDTANLTVMSYSGRWDPGLRYSPLDLAALQFSYGPSTQANAGDTRHTLSSTAMNLIYDGAGIDTLDGSALASGATLYLEPGYWGFAGVKADLISAPGQISINFGSVIENAIGTAYADTITGNTSANLLQGGDGNDTLTGAGGDDTIDGGAGADVVAFAAALSGYTLVRSGSTITVRAKSGSDGSDTLTGVEQLRFADATVNPEIQALAARAPAAQLQRLVELYVAFFNRTPDADGMSYWLGQMASGQSTTQIAEAFYNAGVQYSSLTGFSATMSSDAFINVVYKNVLGRAEGADAGGLNYWNGQLASGKATRGSLVVDILNVAHGYKGDTTWGWVANLLDNKIAVAKTVAVDWGISYTSSDTAITKGMAVAAAVTPTDTSAALKLIGVTPGDILLG